MRTEAEIRRMIARMIETIQADVPGLEADVVQLVRDNLRIQVDFGRWILGESNHFAELVQEWDGLERMRRRNTPGPNKP